MIENPEISIDYSLTYEDFAAGRRFGERQNIFIMLIFIVGRYLMPVLAVLLLGLISISFFKGQRQDASALAPLFLLLAAAPIFLWINTRRAYRKLQLDKSQPAKMCFQANAQQFGRKIHGMGELTWLWTATHGLAQNKRLVLIEVRKNCFIFIPRQALTENQISRLKQFSGMVDSHVD